MALVYQTDLFACHGVFHRKRFDKDVPDSVVTCRGISKVEREVVTKLDWREHRSVEADWNSRHPRLCRRQPSNTSTVSLRLPQQDVLQFLPLCAPLPSDQHPLFHLYNLVVLLKVKRIRIFHLNRRHQGPSHLDPCWVWRATVATGSRRPIPLCFTGSAFSWQREQQLFDGSPTRAGLMSSEITSSMGANAS